MPSKEELQQKLMLYQLLQGQLEDIRKQATMLQEQFSDIESSRQSLEDISKLTEARETLIPVGNGVFAHASLKKGTVLVNVGAGVLIKKTPEEATAILNQKIQDVEKLTEGLQKEANGYIMKLQELGQELIAESQKKQ